MSFQSRATTESVADVQTSLRDVDYLAGHLPGLERPG